MGTDEAALAFGRIQQDLRALGTKLGLDHAALEAAFGRLRVDLQALAKEVDIDAQVQTLEAQWSTFSAAIGVAEKEFQRLRSEATGLTDPLFLDAHLFGVLGRGQPRKENRHTQVIAALLGCPLGPELLSALLETLEIPPVDEFRVEAEVWHQLPSGKRIRTDLEISRASSLFIVIENKIDSTDRAGQIDDYATLQPEHLVFLTPTGNAPQNSTSTSRCLSYYDLALAWRRVLLMPKGHPSDDWLWVLRLYLGTVVQGVCRLDRRPLAAVPYLKG